MWKGSCHPATKKARMAGTAINHPIERGSPLQLGASSPVRSASTHCGRSRRSGLQAVIALVCLLAGTLAWAGVADNSSRYGYGVRSEGFESASNGYYAALRESSVARQIASLERFLSFGGEWSAGEVRARVAGVGLPAKSMLPRGRCVRQICCWRLIRKMHWRWRYWLTQEWEARAMRRIASGWPVKA